MSCNRCHRDECDGHCHHGNGNSFKNLLYDVGKTEHANIWRVMFAIASCFGGIMFVMYNDLNAEISEQDIAIEKLQDLITIHTQELGHPALENEVDRAHDDIDELQCSVFSACGQYSTDDDK